MPILNYTTKIDSYKTIVEIQKCLAAHGAQKIVIDNDAAGNPVAMTFCVAYRGCLQGFALPCNYEGVLKAMQRSRKVTRALCTKEQALRVSWRIIKDWIEAQMAIIEAGMAEVTEVFLPYAITKSGKTLFQHIETDSSLLLAQSNG